MSINEIHGESLSPARDAFHNVDLQNEGLSLTNQLEKIGFK